MLSTVSRAKSGARIQANVKGEAAKDEACWARAVDTMREALQDTKLFARTDGTVDLSPGPCAHATCRKDCADGKDHACETCGLVYCSAKCAAADARYHSHVCPAYARFREELLYRAAMSPLAVQTCVSIQRHAALRGAHVAPASTVDERAILLDTWLRPLLGPLEVCMDPTSFEQRASTTHLDFRLRGVRRSLSGVGLRLPGSGPPVSAGSVLCSGTAHAHDASAGPVVDAMLLVVFAVNALQRAWEERGVPAEVARNVANSAMFTALCDDDSMQHVHPATPPGMRGYDPLFGRHMMAMADTVKARAVPVACAAESIDLPLCLPPPMWVCGFAAHERLVNAAVLAFAVPGQALPAWRLVATKDIGPGEPVRLAPAVLRPGQLSPVVGLGLPDVGQAERLADSCKVAAQRLCRAAQPGVAASFTHGLRDAFAVPLGSVADTVSTLETELARRHPWSRADPMPLTAAGGRKGGGAGGGVTGSLTCMPDSPATSAEARAIIRRLLASERAQYVAGRMLDNVKKPLEYVVSGLYPGSDGVCRRVLEVPRVQVTLDAAQVTLDAAQADRAQVTLDAAQADRAHGLNVRAEGAEKETATSPSCSAGGGTGPGVARYRDARVAFLATRAPLPSTALETLWKRIEEAAWDGLTSRIKGALKSPI